MSTEKKRLLGRLEKAISSIPFTQEEREAILTSFNISFEGHRLAPRRATGEIYFMHVFRQCMKMIRLMIRHGVHDANLLCIILLHDVVEDAEEGKTTDFMVRSQIHLLVNDDVVYGVMCMTKKKNIESRDDFLLRLLRVDVWQVLIAKTGDANDNIITLHATTQKTQRRKVEEVFIYYPSMRKRAIHLIACDGKAGNLPNWEKWVAIVNTLHHNLRRNASKQEKRLHFLLSETT